MSQSINVANSTFPFSPTNCVPLSSGAIFWNVCLFFGANIFAHAATIHPRVGATTWNSFRRMMLMVVAPVTAGTVATHAIVSFVLGVKHGGLKWASFLSNRDTLQDAVAAGAVGILVPREYAPVLAGRWKLVGDERHSLMLDHTRTRPHHRTSREPHIPPPDAKLEFILPPQSRLPGYTKHKFYPSSSAANELIAVIQLVYGVYQLVTQYGPEISLMGLSSPYTCVVPYLFMSLVNLVANIVMPSYSHVIILPPQPSQLEILSPASTLDPETSQVDKVVSDDVKESDNVKSKSDDAETVHSDDLEAGSNSTSITLIRLRIRQWRFRKTYRHHVDEISMDKYYMSINNIDAKGIKPPPDGFTDVTRKKLRRQKLPYISFITWSVQWSWFRKSPKKGIINSTSWSREPPINTNLERNLQQWLKQHYPDVNTCIHERPLRVYQMSRYISVVTTLVMTTLIIGVITRFQFMVGAFAGRFISFIYLPPTILLIPFMILHWGGSSVRFWNSVAIFSSIVNNFMFTVYIGAAVVIIQALWSIGDCTVWSQADHKTWL